MWIYAVLIALSRVVITAHHPSDVIGGAIVGAVGRGHGAQLVRRPPARLRRRGRRFGPGDARPELQADHQSGCPPPALCLEGGMSAETTERPRGLRHRSGAERGRKHRPAGGRDRRRAGRPVVRGHLCQRRLDRRHRSRADAPEGAASLASADPPRPLVRAIGGAAHRHVGGARADHRHARRRRPERSGVSAQADRQAGAGRAAHGPRRRPARRPEGHGLQAIPVALRQRGARRDPARRHARHRLRAEGVSARSSAWRCPISTGCIASCRRWSGARAATSAMSMWSTGRARTAYRTMDFGTGCGSAFSISAACGG